MNVKYLGRRYWEIRRICIIYCQKYFSDQESQLNIKLDRDLRNAANNHQLASAEIFDSEDNNDDNRKKEGEEELEDNIDIPIADSYSYQVAIIHIH